MSAPTVVTAMNNIDMSPNYAVGLVIGSFLLAMVGFAVVMMLSIQTSEKMALPDAAYKLPERRRE